MTTKFYNQETSSGASLQHSSSSLQPATSHVQTRCTFTSPGGYQCRRLCGLSHPTLCSRHEYLAARSAPVATTPPVLDTDSDVSADLLGPLEDFRTSAAVNHTLGKLLLLLASNRISPRRGAVLAYTCQLLLQSLGGVKEEISQKTNNRDVYDMVQRVLDATSPLRPCEDSGSH